MLLVADPDDSIVSLLQQMNIDVRLAGKDGDPGAIPSTTRFNAVIISDALMRVDDPCRTLRNARSLVEVGAPDPVQSPAARWRPGEIDGPKLA